MTAGEATAAAKQAVLCRNTCGRVPTLSYFYEPRLLKPMAGDLDPIAYAKICDSASLECRVDGRLKVDEKLFTIAACVCHGAVHVRLDHA